MNQPRARTAFATLAATGLACAAMAFTPATVSATPQAAAPAQAPTRAAEEPSTPVPMPTPEGKVSSYVVNTANVGKRPTARAGREIVAAGGTVVQSWPQIGVVVAHSTHANFLKRLNAAGSKNLLSAGSTRTVPVGNTPPAPAATSSSSRQSSTSTVRSSVSSVLAVGRGQLSGALAIIDPREKEQWDMRLIKADRAHRVTDGSPNVTVAVVDSGIEPDHPDLQSNLDVAKSVNCTDAGRVDTSSTGWYATASGHGTHVAGTIAAARNGLGIVGVAPEVKLASVKVVDDGGFIYPEYAVCGIMWTAQKKIPVANHSYFVDPFEFWCDDQPAQAPAKESVRRAFAYAHKQGVISAAAAGNSNYDLANKTTDSASPNDSTPVKDRKINRTCNDIPAELPNVVTVASADATGERSSFSNYGAGIIDLVAPGRAILSTYTGQRWSLLSGTSMASPHVAGVLALLKSADRDATPNQLFARVRAQADDKACPTGDTKCVGGPPLNGYFGDGMVDALDAVRR